MVAAKRCTPGPVSSSSRSIRCISSRPMPATMPDHSSERLALDDPRPCRESPVRVRRRRTHQRGQHPVLRSGFRPLDRVPSGDGGRSGGDRARRPKGARYADPDAPSRLAAQAGVSYEVPIRLTASHDTAAAIAAAVGRGRGRLHLEWHLVAGRNRMFGADQIDRGDAGESRTSRASLERSDSSRTCPDSGSCRSVGGPGRRRTPTTGRSNPWRGGRAVPDRVRSFARAGDPHAPSHPRTGRARRTIAAERGDGRAILDSVALATVQAIEAAQELADRRSNASSSSAVVPRIDFSTNRSPTIVPSISGTPRPPPSGTPRCNGPPWTVAKTSIRFAACFPLRSRQRIRKRPPSRLRAIRGHGPARHLRSHLQN